MRLAKPVIAEIQSRGKTPIITGGSGLYLKFLTHGPAPLPAGDADAPRRTRRPPARGSGGGTAHGSIPSRPRAPPCRTGVSFRAPWKSACSPDRKPPNCAINGKARPARSPQACAASSSSAAAPISTPASPCAPGTMLDGGAIEEVAALEHVSTNCEKAIGFREIRRLIRGEIDRATCEELINAATRQYAKRQETWFQREKWLVPHCRIV